MFSFLRKPPKSAPKPKLVLFPTLDYQQAVLKTNKEWLTYCLETPLIRNQTKLHILGTLPLNCPTLTNVQFSDQKEMKYTGQSAVEEILMSIYNESDPNIKKSLKLIVNETTQDLDYILNEYYDYFKSCFPTEVNDYFEQLSMNLALRAESMDIGLDMPSDWIEMLAHSGLFPHSDLVFGLTEFKKFQKLDSGLDLELVCINDGTSTTDDEVNTTDDGTSGTIALEEPAMALNQALKEFYVVNCGIDTTDLKKINTESKMVDNIVQRMVLSPRNYLQYDQIIKKAYPEYGDFNRIKAKIQSDKSKARKLVQLVNNHGQNDSSIILMADRDLYPEILKQIKEIGFKNA